MVLMTLEKPAAFDQTPKTLLDEPNIALQMFQGQCDMPMNERSAPRVMRVSWLYASAPWGGETITRSGTPLAEVRDQSSEIVNQLSKFMIQALFSVALTALRRSTLSERSAKLGNSDAVQLMLRALQAARQQPMVKGLDRHVEPTSQELLSQHLTDKAKKIVMPRAEEETYGRSSGTARRLGAFMLKAMNVAEATKSPEADQAKVEFYTSVQEGLGTDKELGMGLEVRDFDRRPIKSGRVMTKDLKTAISKMTKDGLTCAEETARKDRRFLPQVTRSVWDHRNALHVDTMAQGKTPYNTIIVISPFPEEAAAESGNAYWRNKGYVPHLKRGFVQLYHASKGDLLSGSLSFDGSNKEHLRKLFKRIGVDVPAGESTDNWLKYPIKVTLSEEAAKKFAVDIADGAAGPEYRKSTNTIDVTEQHKLVMERVFSESYVHICESLASGRQTAETRKLIYHFADKAHSFNDHYAKSLYGMRANSQFTTDDWAVMHELLVYSTIEMMRALYLKEAALKRGETYEGHDMMPVSMSLLESTDPMSFQAMLGGFGADGAKNNRTYSACGLSISLGNENAENNPQSAFGGVDNEGNESKGGGVCDYVHTGCYCCPYNSDGSSRPSPLKVVARRESDGTAYCKRSGCGAWLSADGKSKDIGYIARRAHARKKQAALMLAA
jgi:hypothetical protein